MVRGGSEYSAVNEFRASLGDFGVIRRLQISEANSLSLISQAELQPFDKQTRYSLIVSFSLPGQEIDIYTPVAVQLGIVTPVEVSI